MKNGITLISEIKIANTLWSRVKGLMFSKDLGEVNGLVIDSCRSIHTFFMNYEIDVVFLSKSNEAVKVIRKIRPWRMTGFYFKAAKVLEVKGGSLPSEISEGDRLELICTS